MLPEECAGIWGVYTLKVGLQLGSQAHSLRGETDVVLALEPELKGKTGKAFEVIFVLHQHLFYLIT